MTTKSKLFLAFGILFAGMFLFIIGSGIFMLFILPQIAGKRTVELNQKRTAEAEGTVTSYSQTRSSGGKYGSSTSSKYSFKYDVGGVTYRNDQSWGTGGKDSEGKKGKVCYDPADPKSSEFYYLEDNKTCGK